MRSHFGTCQKYKDGKVRIFWQEGDKKRSKVIVGGINDGWRELAKIQLKTTGITNNITWREYWEMEVEPSFTREQLAASTVQGYERLWNKELSHRIGNVVVQSTTVVECNRAISSISKASVAIASARLLKKMCNMAIRDGLMQYNPALNVKLPNHKRKRKVLYDTSEICDLLHDIVGIKYEPIILMELGGGLRHEEACAVTREDVSEYVENGKTYALINIDKAITSVKGGKVLKETKNEHSTREVIIGEPFASRLLKLAKGSGAFLGHDGDYSNPQTMTHNWKYWCDRNGVKYVCPKNLRSTYATIQGECGSPDSIVSGQMGHAQKTTKGINYQTITRRGLVLIADNLEEHLSRFNRTQIVHEKHDNPRSKR